MKVLVAIKKRAIWNCDTLPGIRSYVQEKELNWQLLRFVSESVKEEKLQQMLDYADAAIVNSGAWEKETENRFKAQKKPYVLIRHAYIAQCKDVTTILDYQSTFNRVANYFEQKGFQNFLLVTFHRMEHPLNEITLYKNILAKKKKKLSYFSISKSLNYKQERKKLSRVLKSLQKPLCIYVSDDWQAHFVLEICHELGIQVPHEVSLLSIGKEPNNCLFGLVEISHLEYPGKEMGYHAASQLHELTEHGTVKNNPLLVKGDKIIEHKSTESIATEDSIVIVAKQYIAENVRKGINVNDVVAHLGVSRRSFEYRFTKATGVAPLIEIQNLRLKEAKHLLEHSHHSATDIAALCGYSSIQHFTRTFRNSTGQTPKAYRMACFKG